MNLKRTLVLVGVALALGLWAYYGERQFDIDPAAARLEMQLGRFEQTDVDTITIITGADTIRAGRRGSALWVIDQPVLWPAESSKWESIVRNIRTSRRERAWVVSADSLPYYQLDPPRARVILSMRGENAAPDTLDIGQPTPIDSRSYVRYTPSDTIMTTSIAVHNAVLKGLYDLRDKSLVVGFDPAIVQQFHMERGEETFTIAREGDRWKMTEPVERYVDKDTMNALLDGLKDFRAVRFHDHPQSLGSYGLEPAAAVAGLTLAEGVQRGQVRILVGRQAEPSPGVHDPGLYVMDATRDMSVLVAPKDFAKQIRRPMADYWDRHVALFQRHRVNRLSISSPESTFTMSQDSIYLWHLDPPHEGEAKRWAVNRLVAAIDEARVKRFIATRGDYGLNPPRLSVTLFRDEEVLGRVDFGKTSGSSVYATGLTGEEVVLVDRELLDRVPRTVKGFTDALPPRPPAPQTRKIDPDRTPFGPRGIPGM